MRIDTEGLFGGVNQGGASGTSRGMFGGTDQRGTSGTNGGVLGGTNQGGLQGRNGGGTFGASQGGGTPDTPSRGDGAEGGGMSGASPVMQQMFVTMTTMWKMEKGKEKGAGKESWGKDAKVILEERYLRRVDKFIRDVSRFR